MFIEGMAPVYRILPNRIKWTRIKDRLNFFVGLNLCLFDRILLENI